MDSLEIKDSNLEIGKTYDIVYCTKYDIEYLNSANLYKKTSKMYFFDYAGVKQFRIRKDSIISCKLSTKQL